MRASVAPALRVVRSALWFAVLALLALLAARVFRHALASPDAGAESAAAMSATPLHGVPAPGFTLVDQFGQSVSLSQFRGKAVVLAFVDSQCTTICPLTAATLQDARQLLGPAAAQTVFLAVNVNAAHNAVADVYQWSAQHGMLHDWLFLTGSAQQLQAVWQDYHIYVQVISDALMHDPAVYVIDPQGREQELFQTQPSPLAADIGTQGRLLAQAAAATLGYHGPLRQRGPVPVPFFPQTTSGAGGFVATPILPRGAPQVSVGQGTTTLVDFFSATCVGCRKSLPVLSAYASSARAAGLPPLVMVDLDFGGLGGTYGLPQGGAFPVVLDDTGALTDAYGVTALPYMACTAGDGRIVWRHIGALSLNALQRAVRAAGCVG